MAMIGIGSWLSDNNSDSLARRNGLIEFAIVGRHSVVNPIIIGEGNFRTGLDRDTVRVKCHILDSDAIGRN